MLSVVAAVVLAMAVWAGPVRAACQIPKGMITLALLMEDAKRGGAGHSDAHLIRVEQAVKWWRSHRFTGDQLGLDDIRDIEVFERLADEAEAFVRTAGHHDARLFAPVLAQARALIRSKCGSAAFREEPDEPKEMGAGLEADGAGSFGAARAKGSGTSGLRKAGGLFALLGVLIWVVVALSYIYRWGFSYVYNRRACRIEASLEFGLDVVDGTVSILGLKGCRFVPVNAGARDRLDVLSSKDAVYLMIGQTRTEGRVKIFDTGYVAVFFVTPLTRAVQGGFLEGSSITPYHVPQRLRLPWTKTAPRKVKKKEDQVRGPLYGVLAEDEDEEDMVLDGGSGEAQDADEAAPEEGGEDPDAEPTPVGA